MLNRAYKIGADLASAEVSQSEDPKVIQTMVQKLLKLKDPVEINNPDAKNKVPTDVTTSVSWGNKSDLSRPVG